MTKKKELKSLSLPNFQNIKRFNYQLPISIIYQDDSGYGTGYGHPEEIHEHEGTGYGEGFEVHIYFGPCLVHPYT